MVMIIFCLSVKEKEGLIIGSYISSGYYCTSFYQQKLICRQF